MTNSENVLPHNIYNVTCTGDEDSLLNCTYSTKPVDGLTCGNFDDAAVICQGIIKIIKIIYIIIIIIIIITLLL